MKRIILLFILISSFCHAQDYGHTEYSLKPNFLDSSKKKHFFISANIGISIPSGDYGSASSNSFLFYRDTFKLKGYADVGFHGNIAGGYFLVPNVAIVAKAGLDIASFLQSTLNAQTDSFPLYQIHSNFKIWQFMGGFYFRYVLYKNSVVWVQGMMGIISANYPSVTISSPGQTVNLRLENATGFGTCASIGFENTLTKTTSIVYSLSYTNSHLSHPSYTYTYQGVNYTVATANTMFYAAIQLTGGINFHL